MDRRELIRGIAFILFAAPVIVRAQPGRSLPMIGVLHSVHSPQGRAMTTLRDGLRELGYVDGQNMTLMYRSAQLGPNTLRTLATELVQRNVSVLYAVGPAAVRAATQATSTVPIVAMDLESDPVASGWAQGLARPGGNVTGLFLNFPELAGKWLQLLRDADPEVRAVGILWDSTTGSTQLDAVKVAAQGYDLHLSLLGVRTADDLDDALRTALKEGVKAIVVLSSPVFDVNSSRVAALTIRSRLPAISAFREFADAGGLMAYGPDLKEFFRRSALYVAKIIEGAKPGDLPIEQPTKFQLVINLKTAKALGLTIPPSLRLRADEVIQ
jgi:putative tryptophan/tyrosine transport system substrate-binding protein